MIPPTEATTEPLLGGSLAEPTAVDEQLVDTIVRDFGVDTQRQAAGLGSYLTSALGELLEAIQRWLMPRLSSFEGLGKLIVTWGPRLLVLVLVIAALALFGQWWRHRRPATAAAPLSIEPDAALAGPAHDREQELRSALADGDPTAALAALWWWLAERLSSREVDPAWTSRELIVRAGRSDLMPPIRRFDRMLYGAGSPTPTEVETLWHQLREQLT